MDLKSQLLAQPLQQLDIARATRAKGEIGSDTKAAQVPEVSGEIANEGLAALGAEALVEMDQQQGVNSQRLDGAQLLRKRINQRRHARGRDHRIGVTIKSEDQRLALAPARICDRLANDLLMTQVDPIKKTNRHADLPSARINLVGRRNNSHQTSKSVRVSASASQEDDCAPRAMSHPPHRSENAMEQRKGVRRATGDVHIHRDNGIDAAAGGVVQAENAAAAT